MLALARQLVSAGQSDAELVEVISLPSAGPRSQA